MLHRRMALAAHIVPEHSVALDIATAGGCWRLAALATATRFYSAEAQVWHDAAGGACVIHGLIWRLAAGAARLIDAAAIAALLDRPGRALPPDIAGEYAIARLHPCGTLEALSDAAGLHQLFHHDDGRAAVANRAGLLAALAGTRAPEPEAALWIAAIGYRAGPASGWRGIVQLAQARRLVIDRAGLRRDAIDSPVAIPAERGFDRGGSPLLEEGLEQAKAAVRLAAGGGAIDLPITGGKDSRAVLAIALAAGLRDRLSLFTRGYAGHPDVVAGAGIAAAIGLPHRRDPPLGSDRPADLTAGAFTRLIATIAFQADGAMGGWDDITGRSIGRDSLITGHMGELLKAYAKGAPDAGPLDPLAMVRLQGPFDPIGLLRPAARALLADRLAARMDEARAEGAAEGDLPDLFYWRNRIPNWLGGIRGIKSFERQPVMPLGVPALLRLAFRMTPDERRCELAHFHIVARAAPALLPLPFAHQRWSAGLPGAPDVAPVLAAAGSALFGTWQWSLNRNPAVRAQLAGLFAGWDIPLWDGIDRAALIAALHDRRFDYFDAIGVLGIAVSAFHQAGLVCPQKLGAAGDVAWPAPPADPPRLAGHLDAVGGAAELADDGRLRLTGAGKVRLDGWLHAPDWPGAGVAIEARADGQAIAAVAADAPRADLAAAGIGDGRHGFTLEIDAAALAGVEVLTLAGFDTDAGPAGGRWEIAR